LDAVARIKKSEDQLRRTIRDLRTQVAKCTDVDGWIGEHLLQSVTNLSFKHKIKIKLTVSRVVVSVAVGTSNSKQFPFILPFTVLL
jgi:hypothetical protein